MKRSSLLFAAVAVLFAVLGAAIAWWRLAPGPAEPAAVDVLFAQTLPDPHGQAQPLGQWRNSTVVLNFWATWCAPCVDEMPELAELHEELSPQGTHVLGVGIDTHQNIAQFAEKLGIEYPLFVGGAGATELARRFGNQSGGLPFTVLIDATGEVRKTYLGRLKMDELRRDLANL
ncbi:MAG TPA: redoxin domain-containing protein [Noviherbaspirillum sp.]|nr:redoxin domain-containing protein [Noviherbaspirillum sp.]